MEREEWLAGDILCHHALLIQCVLLHRIAQATMAGCNDMQPALRQFRSRLQAKQLS